MDKYEERLATRKAIAPFGIHKNGQPIKVLVVDDVFIDRRIMTQILRSAGFDVIGEAKNGEEGLRLVANEQPHLVILDYVMPKMNGLEVLIQIKKRYSNIPVIMSTSESEKELARTLMVEGASDYILKPFNRPMILQKLKKIVEVINQAPTSSQQT